MAKKDYDLGGAILSFKRKRGKGRLSASTLAGRRHAKVMAKTEPGTGERFASLKREMERKGARSPGALAAWIGRRKYGKRFQQMAATGRRKA